VSQTIHAFFEEFQRWNADGDTEKLARLYAPVFLAAGANGAQPVKSADLALAIPKRRQMLEAIGCRPASLVSLEETELDARYTMARMQWQWRVERGEAATVEITLGSTVILQRSGEGLQIVLYLNHEDIFSALRQRGLLPEAT
jgi:hypothetical protein